MKPEKIIREHRRWTRWLQSPTKASEGNLVLTNYRLLFLHRISPGKEVSENIKKLADAPIKQVLDYAFTLHRNNFQMPLSAITRVGVGVFTLYPYPRFCVTITYCPDRNQKPRNAAFQFRDVSSNNWYKLHLITVYKWAQKIRQTILLNDNVQS